MFGMVVLALGIWARDRTLLLCALWLVVVPAYLVSLPLRSLLADSSAPAIYNGFFILNAVGNARSRGPGLNSQLVEIDSGHLVPPRDQISSRTLVASVHFPDSSDGTLRTLVLCCATRKSRVTIPR